MEADRRVHAATSEDERRLAVEEGRACQENVDLLRPRCDEQQGQLDEIEFQTRLAEAELARLRTQRDVLQARLRVATLGGAAPAGGGRPSRRRLIVAACGVLVLVGGLLSLVWPALHPYGRSDLTVPPDEVVAASAEAGTEEGELDPSSGVPAGPGEPEARGSGVAPPGEVRSIQSSEGGIRSLVVTADGHVLAGTSQGALCVWDPGTGDLLLKRRIGSPAEPFPYTRSRVAISPDGRYAACFGLDAPFRILTLPELAEVHQIATPFARLKVIAFSPDSRHALAGGGSHWTGTIPCALRLWDVETATEVVQFDVEDNVVTAAAFSPDGRSLLAGLEDHTIGRFNTRDGSETRRLEGHIAEVSSIQFLPDGRRAFSGSHDTMLRLWDLSDGVATAVFEGHHDQVHQVAVSRDGRYGLSAGSDRTLRLWNLERSNEVCCLKGHDDRITCTAFLPDNHFAVTGSDDATIRVWRLPIPTQDEAGAKGKTLTR
ncbi:MAG: WD40 repeat domain-containing protein [Planctomycetes bacterium]|nr:WD40 repeat domain-containing protein [Planctomycetota bacterium]